MSNVNLELLTSSEQQELLDLLEEEERVRKRRKLLDYYPETGPLRRELYAKHMEFFEAGVQNRERLFLAANRVGKTEGAGGYETALHLTGWYPDWWQGRRFDEPVRWWAAGKTNETSRDIVQAKLMGALSFEGGRKAFAGTGLIPGETIGAVTWKQGVADLADRVQVKHKSGGWSVLGVKSYQQGRGSFEGTEQEGVWLDEEPPLEVYTECLTRTATTGGMILLTFTPLSGWSDVVKSFLETVDLPTS